MKQYLKRSMSAMLALLLVISLFSGLVVPAQAATVKNYGYRGDTAKLFSSYATKFYSKNDVTYEDLAALSGSSDVSTVPGSPLYNKLQQLMRDNHTHITDYKETIEYYPYTDCQGEGDVISSFYSGVDIGPEWDSGATWNREHTWPNSKGLDGDDENDIMMLRPTSSSENSARSNKAYGLSSGFYNPNTVSGGLYNLHGDVARIALYVYVRWGNTGKMWGSEGVIESKEILLNWMQEDPVDTWELGRNDAVMSITGTRNVFVDYPELAFLLFNEEVPAGMITPSGNSGETYQITATVNDAAMGSVTVAGTNIKATPAEGYRVEGYEVISGEASVVRNENLFTVSPKSDCTIQINFSLIPVPETLEEQLAEASKLENKTYLPYTTTIEGKVSEIADPYNTQYKNITFYVNVNGTSVYCYRVKGEGMETLAVGDTVKVVGNLTAYNHNPQFDSKATVTIIEKAPVVEPEEPDVPVVPEGEAVVLNFSGKENRVSYSTSQQVWAENGITLTNNKASSTSNVGDYANPARFYKGSEVTIEYPGMTKVVFHCTGGSKYYMNVSDVKHLGTVTANNGVITLVLDAPADSITYTCASNQHRYTKIEVFAAAPEEEGCKHENLTKTDAVAASCYTEGNVAYWSCPDCQLYWLDEALTQETTADKLVIAPAHGQITHVEAVAPTYEKEGNIEYWFCPDCGQAWLDAECTRNTNLKAVILPMLIEEPDEPQEPETVGGTIDFTTNDQRTFFDKNDKTVWENDGITFTNSKGAATNALRDNPKDAHIRLYAKTDVKIECAGMTKLVFTTTYDTYVEPMKNSLSKLGNVTVDGLVVTLELAEPADSVEFTMTAQARLTKLDVTAAAPEEEKPCEHVIEHVAESCYNTEYWVCNECLTYWADAELVILTNSKNVIKAVPSHKLTYTEESCYNTPYWFCDICEIYWADAELTQITNAKNVIKAEPSHDLEHTAESCYNTEYWFCEICEIYWADAELTQITNSKNVIKAVPSHDLKHVEAKAATCVAQGNVEHWYCEACEAVWTDEALTKISNHQSVITPVDEEAHQWGTWKETKAATCTAKGTETSTCKLDADHQKTRDIAKIKHVDKDKDDKCDVCKYDMTNSATGDMILISVAVMVAALAMLLFLMKPSKGKFQI